VRRIIEVEKQSREVTQCSFEGCASAPRWQLMLHVPCDRGLLRFRLGVLVCPLHAQQIDRSSAREWTRPNDQKEMMRLEADRLELGEPQFGRTILAAVPYSKRV
jgi:hypothetical protein